MALGVAAWWLSAKRSLASLGLGAPPAPALPAASATPRSRRGGMDLTFLVTADTHFGHGDIAKQHVQAIAAMNAIAGTPFPAPVGGAAGTPRGLLVAGDLTEDGRPEEWAEFLAHYEDTLAFPLYESWGNHDKHYGWYVKERIIERHGGIRYSFDWDDVHVVCLGEAPDHDDIAWLSQDLARAGKDVGVVVYFHFPLSGPYSQGHWFGKGDYKRPLMAALMGHHVLGIFHGHYHASGITRYEGHDVYNVGSPKHGFPDFAVVRITDGRMTVAAYNHQQKRFWWWHDKPIFGHDGPTHRFVSRGLVGATE